MLHPATIFDFATSQYVEKTQKLYVKNVNPHMLGPQSKALRLLCKMRKKYIIPVTTLDVLHIGPSMSHLALSGFCFFFEFLIFFYIFSVTIKSFFVGAFELF